jgi:hypothetical protein
MEWQPIASAPKDGTDVWLTDGHWKRSGYWARLAETWSVDTAVQLKPPTHWAPMPKFPREAATHAADR